MAKRQRPDGGDEATFAKSDGTKDRGRPHKSCKPASRQPYPAAQQPEATVRGLQAADIRAPGMSSTSTFAQLQLRELLSEVRADDATGAVQSTVQELTEILMGLPSREVAPSKIKGFAAATGFAKEAKPLAFAPPTSVSIAGGHATQSAICSSDVVDIAVELPAACFEHKDHLNHRYHAKRATYLTALAQQLAKHPRFADQQWSCFDHDARKPALLINSSKSDDTATTTVLRLLPTCDPQMLQLRRLAPDSNAVRSIQAPASAATQAASVGADALQPEQQPAPTPHYNTSILQDALLARHTTTLQAACAALPRLADALALLRSWARQQGCAGRPDGVTGFHLSMLAAHLHQRTTLSLAMTAPQLMRAVLAALAEPRTLDKGLFMARGEAAASDLPVPPPAAAFRKGFDVAFVDASGWLNLMGNVTRSSLQHAQQAARRTVKLLDSMSGNEDAFDAAFLAHHGPAVAFDCVVRVTLPAPGEAALTTSDEPTWRTQDAEVERIAKRALGTRARLVRALRRSLDAVRPAKGVGGAATDEVLLCVTLDPAAAGRPVDMGPGAENAAAAAEFRAFWGDKAELRRFPDGSIAEAVVWEVPPGERHLVVDELLAYTLRRHLPLGTQLQTHSGCLDGALLPADGDLSDAVAASRQLEAATDKVGKQLRGLADLTLRITAVQSLSAASRHTSPFPPQPHPLAVAGSGGAADGPVPRCMEAVELLVHLEGSGRWPAEEAAFWKVKAALGCQLAEALGSSFGVSASASEACVDVLADGFAFRLFLWSTRDEAMARTAAANGTPNSGSGSAKSASASSAARAAATLPQQASHHGLVAALAAEAPAFVAVAALASRWLAAHMFSGMVSAEAAELLAAAAFTGPSTLPTPGSRVAGFLRVLALLASHPWAVRPLIVDPASEIPQAGRRAAVQAFDAATAAGTAPAMWLVAAYSGAGAAPWVQPTFGRAALQRLVACARSSLDALQEAIAGAAADAEPEEVGLTVFCTPLAAFDALLTLRPEALPQAAHSLLPDPVAAAPKTASALADGDRSGAPLRAARAVLSSIPADVVRSRGAKRMRRELLVGFEPLPLYAAVLEERFGHLAAFFWDGFGGRAVGVKWRPHALRPAPFSPATAHAVKPATAAATATAASNHADGADPAARKAAMAAKGGKVKGGCDRQQLLAVVPDLGAALAQMHGLGAGLVQDVLTCGVLPS